jgi:purine-cytosine permease-like protein
MIDGFLLGAFCSALGIVGGLLIAHYYEVRRDDRDASWSRIVQQQQAQIDDLTEYIADHSDAEANAEDLWGHG